MNQKHLNNIKAIKAMGRRLGKSKWGDKEQEEALGPLALLPGTWKNVGQTEGHGWNCIALPFEQGQFNYRLLVNQYNETLTFKTIDKGVPNRGLPAQPDPNDPNSGDQFVTTLDYEQNIVQVAADDFPQSGLAGDPGAAIHHEPGLFLNMLNHTTDGVDVARLGSVPHGNSVLAMGQSAILKEMEKMPNFLGFPEGEPQDLNRPYLSPYKHFNDNPFVGTVAAAGFPGFNPIRPLELLDLANQGVKINKVTKLPLDTEISTTSLVKGGISSIPFIIKQADASSMKSTFWIQELAEKDKQGNPKLRLQYAQIIYLDFFTRPDGAAGRIRWPHVSINTLDKVSNEVECD